MKTEIICNFLNESCLNLFLNAQCFIKSKHIRIFSLISTNLAEIIFSPMINVMHLFFRKQNTKWMKIDPCLVGNRLVSIQASGWPPNDGLGHELSYHYTAMMFNVENVILKKVLNSLGYSSASAACQIKFYLKYSNTNIFETQVSYHWRGKRKKKINASESHFFYPRYYDDISCM